MKIIPILIVALVTTSTLAAQNGSSPVTRVPIRLNQSGASSPWVESGPDGVKITDMSLLFLVMTAYDLQEFQVAGIPTTMLGLKYDIDLGNVTDWKQLLQSVLVERFKLASHRETRQENAYDLVVLSAEAPRPANSEKCQARTESPCRGFNAGPTWINGQQVSMDQLSSRLTRSLGRIVLNKTGLKGTFDVALLWTVDQTPRSPADATASTSGAGALNIFAALEQQLGLKLVPTTTSVDILRIDHAEAPVLK